MIPKDLSSFAVGFDALQRLQDELRKAVPGFPPYNIKKIEDGSSSKYLIELAVAGYSLADIEVELEEGVLTVKSKGVDLGEVDFIHKGFTHKAFTRNFTLAREVVVESAKLADGILSIFLRKEEEKKKSVKINVESPTAASHPTLLNEESTF